MLLKYFRNIPASALNALFPNARVVMSSQDKLALGMPAIAGGVPILLKIYATVTVLFLVIAFCLGQNPTVEQKDMATALAALGGLVALAGASYHAAMDQISGAVAAPSDRAHRQCLLP